MQGAELLGGLYSSVAFMHVEFVIGRYIEGTVEPR